MAPEYWLPDYFISGLFHLTVRCYIQEKILESPSTLSLKDLRRITLKLDYDLKVSGPLQIRLVVATDPAPTSLAPTPDVPIAMLAQQSQR